jgi:MFS family permease
VNEWGGMNYFTLYSKDFFTELGGLNIGVCTTLIGAFSTIGALFGMVLGGNILGRKKLFLIGNLLQTVCFWAVGVFYFLRLSWPVAISSFIFCMAFGVSLGSTANAFLPEILPPSGMSFIMMVKFPM